MSVNISENTTSHIKQLGAQNRELRAEIARLQAELEQLRTRYNMLDMAYRMQLDEVKRLRNEG